MRLRLINLEKYCGVLTVPDHTKLAAMLLEEQDFFKVATGTLKSNANDGRDNAELGGSPATREESTENKVSHTCSSTNRYN